MENNFNKIEESEKIYHINYSNGESLKNIYDVSHCEMELKRYTELLQKFENITYPGYTPTAIARAPGRVNLIGEHIDYEGFAVLPMAIENDILIAINASHSDGEAAEKIDLHINHFDSNKFKSYEIKIDKEENLKFVNPHDWVNYVIAGYNAIINFIIEKKINRDKTIKEIRLLFTGNVPPAAGLSSSSALTVCSALAFTKIFQISEFITKNELSLATINYERSVGTACGGMDQTISIYAVKDQAKLIEFYPKLSTKGIYLPNNVSFIIANSLTDSAKIDTLAFRYNKRVLENKLGLAIISKKLNLGKPYRTTIELKTALGVEYNQLLEIIEKNLKQKPYSIEDIQQELTDIDEILCSIPYYHEVLSKNKEFKLKDRLVHVCKEAERVENFYEICKSLAESEDKIKNLGMLMNESHRSCRDLYECSSQELDSLTEFCLDNKAVGARLTGAGWGGCSVIMVRNEDLNYITEKLKDYYSKNEKVKIDSETFFVTKASQGSCIFII
jgi:N-acetylgalactosamine kinase